MSFMAPLGDFSEQGIWLVLAWLLGLYPVSLLASRLFVWCCKGLSAFAGGIQVSIKRAGVYLLWFLSGFLLRAWVVQSPAQMQLVSAFQSLILLIFFVVLCWPWLRAKVFASAILILLLPVIALQLVGLLDQTIEILDQYSFVMGNFKISLNDLFRIGYLVIIVFWVGLEFNRLGKSRIRKQKKLDARTQEIIAKLFEVGVFSIIFLIMLNILGINPTTLAVVAGALGVGLGFGLQSIASNFVSGIVILLDRSLSIGDFIELPDGQSGTIREVNLRSVTLETFDGKDIVVPNDVFFSETFTNWTHKNQRQRYAIDFAVAYSSDLDRLFPLIKSMLAQHPEVISGDAFTFEEQPDVEIANFGDNGIDLHIEFWMDAIDDGKYRVGGDLLYELWKLMKTEGFEFPFPQRDVRIIKEK